MVINAHYSYISPKKFTKSIRGQLVAAVTNAQNRMLKYLKKYTETWDHQPVWVTKGMTGYGTGDIYATVWTDDLIFWWLEDGTSKRYAIMYDPFASKTSPGYIGSREGHRTYKTNKDGSQSYYRLDMNSPVENPGIEARHVLQEIVKADFPKFNASITTILANISFLPPRGAMP